MKVTTEKSRDLQRAEELLALARTLVSDIKKRDRLSEKALAASESGTPKAAGKASADLHWQGMEVTHTQLLAHVAAVNCGLAEARDREEYGEVIYRPSGWHEYTKTVPLPDCLQEDRRPKPVRVPRHLADASFC